MRPFFTVVALCLLAVVGEVRAQAPLILTFPATSCDSVRCGVLPIDTATSELRVVQSWRFRDGVAYTLDSSALQSDTLLPGTLLAVPVCFRPVRRGQITDSVTIVLMRLSGPDTVQVRLTGLGIGPELTVDPSALNFPRTNPPASTTLRVQLGNIGELPLLFTAASLALSPPFRLITPVPLTIDAGATIGIDISFEPTEKGIFTGVAELLAGCNLRYQIGLNGATDLIGLGAVLRTSKVGFNPINHEEIPCGASRCTELTLSNAGNTHLTIEQIQWALNSAGYSITTPYSLPIEIEAGGKRTFNVCLDSRQRGSLEDTLVITSNSRVSIAVGMLLDVSKSMDSLLNCQFSRPKRITEAIFQAQNFIARTLLHLPNIGVQDQLTIMKFSQLDSIKTIFPLQFITETLRAQAEASISGLIPRGGTFTNTALGRLIDTLATSPLQNRVIVLLSDGAVDRLDLIPSPAQLISRANARGVRIFTIGIGTDRNRAARDYLLNLARGTSGSFFDGNNCDSLQDAFETITDLLSRGTVMREPFAMKVTAPYIIASGDINFDSTYFREITCRQITLTNVGEGTADIDSMMLRDAIGATTNEFFFGPSVRFPIRVAESGQENVEVCFQPQRLRQRAGNASLTYNSCAPHIVRTDLRGTGWARAELRASDSTIALPDARITIPIHLDSSLALYEVDSVTFSIRWNKTMLDLRNVTPGPAARFATLVSPVVYSGRDASVSVVTTGDFLTPADVLAFLEFRVLRGDTLGSEIAITSARFADDNPRALVKNSAFMAFDSTCFRNDRQISVSAPLARVTVGEPYPHPARRSQFLAIPFAADAPASVMLRMHASDGRVLMQAAERQIPAGQSKLDLDLSSLPVGTGYLVIETPTGETALRPVVIVE